MTTDAPKDPVVPKRRETAPEPEEGADHGVSPEGVPYQAPSRPFSEQDEPGQPPEVDPDVEAKLKAQADEAAARYQGRKAEVHPEPDQATKTTTK